MSYSSPLPEREPPRLLLPRDDPPREELRELLLEEDADAPLEEDPLDEFLELPLLRLPDDFLILKLFIVTGTV